MSESTRRAAPGRDAHSILRPHRDQATRQGAGGSPDILGPGLSPARIAPGHQGRRQSELEAVKEGIDAKLGIENGPKYSRSNNLAILWFDAKFIYNAGFFKNQTYADQDFMETCAHEFGHSVLTEFGGIGRSWTHEGSTSIFQSTTASTPGYPQTGEINLMRYYDEKKSQASFQRMISGSRATEFDLLCLLWMSKLAF